MNRPIAHQIVIATPPKGRPQLTDVGLEEAEVPEPSSGQILLEVPFGRSGTPDEIASAVVFLPPSTAAMSRGPELWWMAATSKSEAPRGAESLREKRHYKVGGYWRL